MTKTFRPMLACETPEDLNLLKPHFPMFASYKIDGIRAIVRNGVLVSRTLKPIPSKYAQQFATPELEGFDGELLACKPVGPTIYHDTFSVVMTHGCMEPMGYWVFDNVIDTSPCIFRLVHTSKRLVDYKVKYPDRPCPQFLEQIEVRSVDDILELETRALDLGHEGLIVRRRDAPYKCGRSTLREGYLVKIARTLNSEAVIVDMEELMHNDNPQQVSALGLSKRSSHIDNLRPAGMMGALIVKDVKSGAQFKIGTGFDQETRLHIWRSRDHFIGKYVKYKYKPYGTKELPRQPSFLGFRDPIDM